MATSLSALLRSQTDFMKPTLNFKQRGSYDFKPSIINIQEYIRLVYAYLSRADATTEEKIVSQVFTKPQELNLALVETSSTKKGVQIAQYSETLSTKFSSVVVWVMASDSRNIMTPFSFSFDCSEDARTQIVSAMKAIDAGWKAPKKWSTATISNSVSDKVTDIQRKLPTTVIPPHSPLWEILNIPEVTIPSVGARIQLTSQLPQRSLQESSTGSPLLDYINNVPLSENDKPNNIPDSTLASLLYHIRNSQDVMCIDPAKKIYFVPDTLMQSVLRSWDLHGLTGDYLTEAAILQNIPHALKQKWWAFLTVFRINVDLFENKQPEYTPDRIEQLELLTATPKNHVTEVHGVRYNFIQHNLETVQIAIWLTNEWNGGTKNLLNFYGAINRWDSASNKTLIKWHCLVLPEWFNIDEIMNDIHSRMTDSELVWIVMKLKKSWTDLRLAIDAQQGMLDVLNQRWTSLSDTIRSTSDNLSNLERVIEKLQEKDILASIDGDKIRSSDLSVRFRAMSDAIMLLQTHKQEITLLEATRDTLSNERTMIAELEHQMVTLEWERLKISSEIETLNQSLEATNKDLWEYTHIVRQKLTMLQDLMGS